MMEEARYRSLISLAGVNITIDYYHIQTAFMCRKYMTKEQGNLLIRVGKSDIEYEKSLLVNTRQVYDEYYYESQALLRIVSEHLINYGTILMHGAVICVDEKAYMFTANSGIGKTTHVQKWIDNIPRAIIINGDKPFLRIIRDAVYVCGSPWCGKENLNTNTIKPLKSVVILERNEINSIKEISTSQSFPYLLQHTYVPMDCEKAKKVLSLLHFICENVSIYLFQCNNFKDDCFDVAYNALVGKQP